MREIKFRVWDKILCGYSKNTMGWYHGENGIVSPETGDRYIFEQCIGVPDKNGKEIYEGDIVVGDSNIKFIVVWSEKQCCFFGQNKHALVYCDARSFCEKEIIGSIHNQKAEV